MYIFSEESSKSWFLGNQEGSEQCRGLRLDDSGRQEGQEESAALTISSLLIQAHVSFYSMKAGGVLVKFWGITKAKSERSTYVDPWTWKRDRCCQDTAGAYHCRLPAMLSCSGIDEGRFLSLNVLFFITSSKTCDSLPDNYIDNNHELSQVTAKKIKNIK